MTPESNSIDLDNRKAQMEMQNRKISETLRQIKNKILIMSGKGGVGKSSVAAYLSVSLANRGYRVGLMDVDLHGPSIPRILGLKGAPGFGSREGKMLPVRYSPNMDVISIQSFLGENKDAATIWRGPLKIGAIRQFISDIEWVNLEILGLVENMSGLKCPHCGEIIDVFKRHGGAETASKENLRLLATLPMELEVVREGDRGDISLLSNNELKVTQEFHEMVEKIVALTETFYPGSDNEKSAQTG